jgi:hypothetical protein
MLAKCREQEKQQQQQQPASVTAMGFDWRRRVEAGALLCCAASKGGCGAGSVVLTTHISVLEVLAAVDVGC